MRGLGWAASLLSLPSPPPPTIAAAGEGLAALWLEAEDVGAVAAALKEAGIAVPPPKIDKGRRVLALDPKIANQVPLFIFDRKAPKA